MLCLHWLTAWFSKTTGFFLRFSCYTFPHIVLYPAVSTVTCAHSHHSWAVADPLSKQTAEESGAPGTQSLFCCERGINHTHTLIWDPIETKGWSPVYLSVSPHPFHCCHKYYVCCLYIIYTKLIYTFLYVCLFNAVSRPSWKITHPFSFLTIDWLQSHFHFVK